MADENVKVEKGQVILKLSPKLYDLDTIYSASYVFLDRSYIMLDGSPDKEIIVRLKPKKSGDAEKIGDEFLNELINYANYNRRSAETKNLREILLHRALVANDPEFAGSQPANALEDDSFLEGIDDTECIDDPEGIALPWEQQNIVESSADVIPDDEPDYADDPEGIAVPWSEKAQEKAEKEPEKPVKKSAGAADNK